MANLQPITLSRHRDQRWARCADYRFAAADPLAPLVVQELPKALMSLPIGFIEQSDGYGLVAVQSLQPGQNLFVSADGRWLGGYVPAVYRGYPFALAKTEDGQHVLCIDEDSGLVLAQPLAGEGEPFFDVHDHPAEPVRKVLDFLQQVAANRAQTATLCAQLADHGLIQPWPLKVTTADGERPVAGLHRIDEAALNALAGEPFETLRQAGALPLIYCQLLSMQQVRSLGKLAEYHAQSKPTFDAHAMFGAEDSLNFNWDT